MTQGRAAPSPAPLPPPHTEIRDGGVGDLNSVMAVMTAAFPATYGEAWTRSQCGGILPMSGVVLRVAGADGAPADGFSLMRIVADEAELLLIAVAPKAQRRGVGQALLEDFIALTRAAGATRLHLEVREGNPAIALYARRGFVPAGRRRDYYHGDHGSRHDAITLVLQGSA